MLKVKGLLFTGLCTLALGCTKVNPNFNTLDQNVIPQPKFGTLIIKEISTQSATQTFAISGSCDPRITSLMASAEGINSVQSQSINTLTSGISVTCASSGTFSFTLKSLTQIGYTVTDGSYYTVDLRAITSGGVSNPSFIKIFYSKEGGQGAMMPRLTSGSTSSFPGPRLAKSANYSARFRIDHFVNSGNSTAKSTPDSKYTAKMGQAEEED